MALPYRWPGSLSMRDPAAQGCFVRQTADGRRPTFTAHAADRRRTQARTRNLASAANMGRIVRASDESALSNWSRFTHRLRLRG